MKYAKLIAILIFVIVVASMIYYLSHYFLISEIPRPVIALKGEYSLSENNTSFVIFIKDIIIVRDWAKNYLQIKKFIYNLYSNETKFKGNLLEILNNESSPIRFYDVDKNGELSIGDKLIIDKKILEINKEYHFSILFSPDYMPLDTISIINKGD